MEHRPLTDQEIIERCCLNLTETYFALARSAQGATPYQDEGVIASFSNVLHPAANIAMIARPSPASLNRLRQQTDQHGPFTSYVLPTTDDGAVLEMCTRAGFKIGNRLNLMFMKPRAQKAPPELMFLQEIPDRKELTLFLAKQFFYDVELEFIEVLANLTATTKSCELIAFPRGVRLNAGAMVHQVRDTLGFYNIAVAPDRRHRGVGGTVMSQLIGLAGARECYAVLQCHDSLVEWYERQGFRRYGAVTMVRA